MSAVAPGAGLVVLRSLADAVDATVAVLSRPRSSELRAGDVICGVAKTREREAR